MRKKLAPEKANSDPGKLLRKKTQYFLRIFSMSKLGWNNHGKPTTRSQESSGVNDKRSPR